MGTQHEQRGKGATAHSSLFSSFELAVKKFAFAFQGIDVEKSERRTEKECRKIQLGERNALTIIASVSKETATNF